MDHGMIVPPQERIPTCALERLNHDALVAVLSASPSLDDLARFIHASPILYACFLEAKREVLLNILFNELGPVIRDGVALSLIGKLDPDQDDYELRLDKAFQQYQNLSAGLSSTRGIAMSSIIDIIHHNRSVQFFVDLYASTRFSAMTEIIVTTAKKLSPAERQHLSQALFRYQVLNDIHLGPNFKPKSWIRGREKLILKINSSLFQAWELEQIMEADAFIYSIYVVLAQANREQTHSWVEDYHLCLFNLELLRQRVVSASGTRSGFIDFLAAQLKEGMKRHLLKYTPCLYAGVQTLDDVYRLENCVSPLVTGDLPTETPYAWVDALSGLNCKL